MKFFKKNYQKLTDEELVEKLSEGKTEAFDELYKRYSKKLLNYFYKMLWQDEAKAQDFLQEVFLKIIENSKNFNSQKKFSTWIFSIGSNLCKNEFRRMEVRRKSTFQQTEAQNFEKKLEEKDFKTELFAELEKMDKAKKETFLLRYQQNLNLEEIAKISGCAVGTVKSRLFYTTKILAEKLEEFNPKK